MVGVELDLNVNEPYRHDFGRQEDMAGVARWSCRRNYVGGIWLLHTAMGLCFLWLYLCRRLFAERLPLA